jgi:transposase
MGEVYRIIETRALVSQLLGQGVSRGAIAVALGISKSTVSYHARRLGHAVDERGARRYDWTVVQSYYDEGHSVRECIARFGFSRQTWHAAVERGAITSRPAAAPIELYLVRGRANTCRTHLKRRLLAEGLKAARCEECGIAEWRGEPLFMALHHVNGDGRDNRLENLRLLCPNCHSQTENFSGRNRGRLEAA